MKSRILISRVILGIGILLSGCGTGDRALLVRLIRSSGAPIEHARAVITGPGVGRIVAMTDKERQDKTEGGEIQAGKIGARFVDDGLLVDSVPSRADVTLKIPGAVFETRRIDLDTLPVENGCGIYEWTVTDLAPFEKNKDYATGLPPAGDQEKTGDRNHTDNMEAFNDLAVDFSTELGPARVVKFTIYPLSPDPDVYFQNTGPHPLHYPFAHDVIGFSGTLAEFEKGTYHGADRIAMAGTLLYYPSLTTLDQDGRELDAPVILTFFPNDDLTPEQAMEVHRLLEERLLLLDLNGSGHRLVYLPAGQAQEDQALGAVDDFSMRDVRWITREALYGNLKLQVLNPGLAYGYLRLMSPEELEKAVVSFTDVLVLTRLPNSLPIVGGTITEEIQTPLAHVNVAARNRGTPNIALMGASSDPRVKDLMGKLVRFEVKDGAFDLRKASIEEARAFWDAHAPEPVVLKSDTDYDGLPRFKDIGFADSVRVGVKAANLAEMSHVISNQTPDGFAVPFHYYDVFMDSALATGELCDGARADCVDEGRAAAVCDAARDLCLPKGSKQEVMWDHVGRIINEDAFRTDSLVREACLDATRYILHHCPVDAVFGDALDARVAEVFGDAKVRLRSSTNAEDLPNFSGAGLYRSLSAYASGKKAASSRIRKVWASAWNWTAFQERAFWGIDHLSVRVGVAVSQAFLGEAANGVLITQNIADPTVAGMYVNVQKGEVSVTNPEDGAVPEVFSIVPGPNGIQVARQRFSSLSPSEPILTLNEVAALFQAAFQVQDHFAPLYDVSPYLLALDMEFKFMESDLGPDRSLFIKQVRPYTQEVMH
ncbi:MAG: hypothetical protein GXP54_04590 [Deltaproteobacteria bacterium]|nr:hypothetical protein [Deltaproteobacteria bacterium]